MSCANPPVRRLHRNTMATIVPLTSPADDKVAAPQSACSRTQPLTTCGDHIRLPLPDAPSVRSTCRGAGIAGGSRHGSPHIGPLVSRCPPSPGGGRTGHACAPPAPGLGGRQRRAGPGPMRRGTRRPRRAFDRPARRTTPVTRSRHPGAALPDLRGRHRRQPVPLHLDPCQDHAVAPARLVSAWSPSPVLNPARRQSAPAI